MSASAVSITVDCSMLPFASRLQGSEIRAGPAGHWELKARPYGRHVAPTAEQTTGWQRHGRAKQSPATRDCPPVWNGHLRHNFKKHGASSDSVPKSKKSLQTKKIKEINENLRKSRKCHMFVTFLSHFCHKNVTKMLQHCDKNVTVPGYPWMFIDFHCFFIDFL